MCGPECRHRLFEAARERAGFSITELWVQYLSLGGGLDLFALEAYLHGLAPLPSTQQDVLAIAVNEQLAERCAAARVPYLKPAAVYGERYEDPVQVLEELLERNRRLPDRPQT